jgi:hypothetical protein
MGTKGYDVKGLWVLKGAHHQGQDQRGEWTVIAIHQCQSQLLTVASVCGPGLSWLKPLQTLQPSDIPAIHFQSGIDNTHTPLDNDEKRLACLSEGT